jgi:hypothetical protein
MGFIAMPVFPSHAPAQYQGLYRTTAQEAAAGGATLMGKLVLAARAALQAREAATRDVRARNALADSAKQLWQWESKLCKRYPQVLLEAFANPQDAKNAKDTSPAQLQFDELELMDELQVQTSVTLVRTQQVAMLGAESSLADLNPLICSMLGMGAVQPERNPLRPEIYVRALKEVIEQTNLPATTQLDWLSAMGVALGEELRKLYLQLSFKLRSEGVVSASYAILQGPIGLGVGRGVAQDLRHLAAAKGAVAALPIMPSVTRHSIGSVAPAALHQRMDSSLLTLDKLRRLLVGEFETPVAHSPQETFAQHFVKEFEGGSEPVEVPSTDFAATVPAALEALQEMQQVDHMVHRLEQRRVAAAAPSQADGSAVDAAREVLRKHAKNMAQSLSLEVVTFMVDNIAMDVRLLEPVQQLVRNLEPALLRLALVDPRFFTDKRHPARLLVQEMTHRSMAYASVDSKGFAGFLRGLEQVLAPLQNAIIDSAEPFEHALKKLQEGWTRAAGVSERQREEAVAALRHAEQRNLLAAKISQEIQAHPQASQVPGVVMNFLCGPWSQVIAQARLAGSADAALAEKYKALIPDLLWSTYPVLVQKNYGKLARLVPPLLATLREGLETIGYPLTHTSEFLEALLGLHQLAFRSAQKAPDAFLEPVPQSTRHTSVSVPAVADGDPWVAPQEANVSNLMEFQDVLAERTETVDMLAQTPVADQVTGDGATENLTERVVDVLALPLGSWLELLVNGAWMRTQLTWASPYGTLFLFTSASGIPQSMTRRTLDKLVAISKLRVISGSPLVDGALNAVARQAMRNSVDTQL